MIYKIDQVNWPVDFPACPETTVELTNDDQALYLHWRVKGEQLRAVTTEDQGPVWEDSCVEFFCQVPGEKHYMNFETNCIGAMVATRRLGKNEGIEPFPPEQMARIERRCTFQREAFEEKDGLWQWEVELKIPLDLIFGEQPIRFPQELRANFYKCADLTKQPHYVSWQPIGLPTPNFHCPEYFGTIVLDR